LPRLRGGSRLEPAEIGMRPQQIVRFKTPHCELTITRPGKGLVLVTLRGRDVGELGDGPFVELDKDLPPPGRAFELFIDAREAHGASIEVSGAWAAWLGAHRSQLAQLHFLSGSRFIRLSADFVRRFAELGETMRIYTDSAAFDQELGVATERALAR
jgi:hypothetical protein